MNNLFPSQLFSWDKELKTAAAYLSDMNGRGYKLDPSNLVRIESVITGKIQEFTFTKVDYADPSHEDIGGWRYSANINGERWQVIFIND